MTKVKFKKIREVKSPVRGTENSAGIDLFIPEDFPEMAVFPNKSVLIPAGLKVDIPDGTMLVVANKSGIAVKKSLVAGACIIDSDYQGEIHINLHNIGRKAQVLKPGDKITQMLHQPIILSQLEEVDVIHEEVSERGEGGFGSTGDK